MSKITNQNVTEFLSFSGSATGRSVTGSGNVTVFALLASIEARQKQSSRPSSCVKTPFLLTSYRRLNKFSFKMTNHYDNQPQEKGYFYTLWVAMS